MTELPIVALDVETDGLAPWRHVWEVAMIKRWPDGHVKRRHYFIRDAVNLARLPDLTGLRVGGYFERHPQGVRGPSVGAHEAERILSACASFRPAAYVAEKVMDFTFDAYLVGANVAFDAASLERLLRGHECAPGWHYRLIDVETYAAGKFGWPYPRGLRGTAEQLDIDVDGTKTHTAMYDAELAMRVYDAVYHHVPAELVEEAVS
ncbi:exonuclease domain-containing protein [Hoyosella altamirensis]|uniref:Exonuclease domain-containing protein n=1 Tax=Hoyosella altamirensis TaxID=616997 RepID=A0A839RVX6_9ACTN|nr:exonuclease domain-containing protein [Hoyosella altamirensis]MBB3040003.1 hypothetical protein [Hoyosella altamirensis]